MNSNRQQIIQLNLSDDVGVAIHKIQSGTHLKEFNLACIDEIPAGHKLALRPIFSGAAIRKYGQIIGYATNSILPGQHVHTHNLAFEKNLIDYAYSEEILPTVQKTGKSFMGFKRKNGKVGTRNYIGILSTVNCSATVARAIAEYFDKGRNSNEINSYQNVDGVVSLTHGTGCGMDSQGYGFKILQRTLAGYAKHPNFGAIIVVGLGCETNQLKNWIENSNISDVQNISVFNIQDAGGTRQSIDKGITHIKELLPGVNLSTREPCSVSNIVLGLQCGGSDGFSGITANPALGAAVDLLVSYGGTAILSETPEIYGAEHLLTRRAINRTIGEKLLDRIRWWEEYTKLNNGNMNNNPSPGNKEGGITTILEKSLGAVSKSGTTPLIDVYEYAEPISSKGFVFMDTPGYDPVSATGQVAGGANLICFTTGRGSAYGCLPSPSLKLATNTDLWVRQEEDIDINCGKIIDGDSTIAEMGESIFNEIILTASGKITKSENLGYGQNEFVPWQLGAVM